MSKVYVLDANALLDFIEDGPGALRVEQLIKGAAIQENSLLVAVVNLGEVFYYLWQKRASNRREV